MKKILYSILTAGFILTGCANFDDVSSENYGDGPTVAIAVTEKTDSTFTFTITPTSGTNYYSYVVVQEDAAKEMNATSLLKGSYKGIDGLVLNTGENATYTFDMRVKGAPLCLPNMTYQIYAVAASDKGVVGVVANASVITSDGEIPVAQSIKADAAKKSVSVTFSEEVIQGTSAITAKYYKEWDITHPVDIAIEELNIDVDGGVVTFTAPKLPANAIATISWAAGAFIDSFDNPCKEMKSGLNMTTGKFTGVYFQAETEAFAIADSCFTAPEVGSFFVDWQAFKGTVTFEFDVFRNESTVKAGDIKVVYSNKNRSTTINLSKAEWSVSGKELTFKLPAEPTLGDDVDVLFNENVIFDVYGNGNTAYTSSTPKWNRFEFTKSMVLGSFKFTYSSDGEVYDGGTPTISEEGDILLIKDLYLEGAEVEGRYDLTTGKLFIESGQILGFINTEKFGKLGLALFSIAENDNVVFTINADGTLTCANDFGVYAFDENFEEGLRWWEKTLDATFTPLAKSKKMLYTKRTTNQSIVAAKYSKRVIKK